MVAQSRLNVTLYIPCLSGYVLYVAASCSFLEVTEYFVAIAVYINSMLKVNYIYTYIYIYI
jgi:hypothetical protein